MLKLLHRYGFLGFLKLVLQKGWTVIFFPSARLIRFPLDIRNKRHIDLGKSITIGGYNRLEAYPSDEFSGKLLTFGKNVEINDYVHIVAAQSIEIGNNVLLASKIFISDLNHGSYSGEVHSDPRLAPSERELGTKPIKIKDNVWLGEFVVVLPGVTIGEGSIIGSMSVVSKDIPPYSIAVGSPARVIKKYDFESKRWERV